MNIRMSFMQLRDEYVDPPEMVKVRKLRSFPFLTNEEILSFGNGTVHKDDDSEVNFRNSIKDPNSRFEMHDQSNSVHSSCLGCTGPNPDLSHSQ